MKIGITGATGFIGTHLAAQARDRDHELIAFSRSPKKIPPGFTETRHFDIDATPDLSGLDAIVHLAGESILGLWTPSKKRRILDSRVEGTRRIVEAIAADPDGPRTFVASSAIGYYGDTGDTTVDETSPAGTGFLAKVARLWEAEAEKAPASVRTTLLRTGFVIGDGGAMKLVGPVFKAGVGGRLGDGQQWMSCVHVDDVAGIILHALESETVSGPLNAVVPEPVRNVTFTQAAAKASHRPAVIPAPALLLKITLGELSHLLLDSQRVLPKATLASGYKFRFPNVASALTAVLDD